MKGEAKMSATKVPAYSMRVFWSVEDDAFIAICPELQGISAFGASQEDAAKELHVAIALAVEVMAEDGEQLPEPATGHTHSGQLRVRMPKSLHSRLSEEAEVEGVSLNSLIVSRLSESAGSHSAAQLARDQFQMVAQAFMARQFSAIGTRPATANWSTNITTAASLLPIGAATSNKGIAWQH